MTRAAKRSVFAAWLLALGLGWCVTILAVIAFWWWDAGRLGPGEPLRLSANSLLVEGAKARREGGTLVVEQLERDRAYPEYLSPVHAGIVWTGRSYREVYPFRYAVCDCTRSTSRASFRFMWQPGPYSQSHSVDFATGPGGVVAVPANASDWMGTVFAFGILLRGDEASQFKIKALELHPDSAWMRARSAWAHWLAFHAWDMKSINTLGKDNESVPSLVAISVGAGGLSIALFLLIRTFRGLPGSAAGVVLLAALSWLLLDVRWFVHLSQQAALTVERFAGLTPDERAAGEQYGPILEFAEAVREAVPSDRTTLFMVTDVPEARFLQERLAFHLYPLNVFNFKRRFWQFTQNVRPGEYLLVLESPEEVSFSEEDSELLWKGKGRVCAEPVISHPVGDLYRICTPEA